MLRWVRRCSAKAFSSRPPALNSECVITAAFALGSALAGAAGLLIAADVDMHPTMGMSVLLTGVVTVIVAGSRGVAGIVLAAILIGVAQHVGAWILGGQS